MISLDELVTTNKTKMAVSNILLTAHLSQPKIGVVPRGAIGRYAVRRIQDVLPCQMDAHALENQSSVPNITNACSTHARR